MQKLPMESASERRLKLGIHLPKLRSNERLAAILFEILFGDPGEQRSQFYAPWNYHRKRRFLRQFHGVLHMKSMDNFRCFPA